MSVERLTQIRDETFTDVRTKVALANADQPAEQGNGNHSQRQTVKEAHVSFRQRDVNQFTDEQRRDET